MNGSLTKMVSKTETSRKHRLILKKAISWAGVQSLTGFSVQMSSSPLRNFNLQFSFDSVSKTFTTLEKVLRRNITEIFECLKGFIMAV